MSRGFLPVLVLSDRLDEHACQLQQRGIETTVKTQITAATVAKLGKCIVDIDMRVVNFNNQLNLLTNAPNVTSIFVYYDQAALNSSEFVALVELCCRHEKVIALYELIGERDRLARQNAALLTERQLDVIRCLIHGHTEYVQIAARLGISRYTVKSYINQISRLIGVSNAIGKGGTRARIVQFALKYLPDKLDM